MHGLSGTPDDMVYLAERLKKPGYDVISITLPGHAKNPEALLSVTMEDWINAVFRQIMRIDDGVCLVGQSMGALIAVHAAYTFKDRIKSIILLAPAIKLYGIFNRIFMQALYVYGSLFHIPELYYSKKNGSDIADNHVKTAYNGYKKIPLKALFEFERLRRLAYKELRHITCPILTIYSQQDHTISKDAGNTIIKLADSEIKSSIVLRRPYHVISIDLDKEQAADNILHFLDYKSKS